MDTRCNLTAFKTISNLIACLKMTLNAATSATAIAEMTLLRASASIIVPLVDAKLANVARILTVHRWVMPPVWTTP